MPTSVNPGVNPTRTRIPNTGVTPESLIADETELARFIAWLPQLKETEAYRLMLMARSTPELKIRGGAAKLETKLIHGYDKAPVSINGKSVELWRFRYYLDVKRMAAEAVHSEWFIVKYHPGDVNRVESVFKVPWTNIALYTTINPLNFIRAAIEATKEVMSSIADIALTDEPLKKVYRRPDERYKDLAMRFMHKRYYVVDVDDPELSGRVYRLVAETLGYRPAKIITRRGVHVFVNIERAKKDKTVRRLFGVKNKRIERLVSEYKNRVRKGENAEKIEKELMDYIWNSNEPIFNRLKVAEGVYTDYKGAKLVEVKDYPLEPLPGTYYKGVIVRFDPGDEKDSY